MSVITYVEGNIVDAMNRGENVVHCVSADFEMGIGVAKALVDAEPSIKYGMRAIHPYPSGKRFEPFTAEWHNGRETKHVYNLVTKERYFGKPTIQTLKLALQDLYRVICKYYSYDDDIELSMPLIASGADRIKWEQTEKLLKEVLPDRFKIKVYKLKK